MNPYSDINWLIRKAKICPYCHQKPEYVDSSEVYGKSYGMIYLCRSCDAYVGVHHAGPRPLGRLANKELRQWKKAAHSYFDPLWRAKKQRGARKKAYKWLSEQMGIPKGQTHIGMFDIEQCQQVIELCKPFYKKNHE